MVREDFIHVRGSAEIQVFGPGGFEPAVGKGEMDAILLGDGELGWHRRTSLLSINHSIIGGKYNRNCRN